MSLSTTRYMGHPPQQRLVGPPMSAASRWRDPALETRRHRCARKNVEGGAQQAWFLLIAKMRKQLKYVLIGDWLKGAWLPS